MVNFRPILKICLSAIIIGSAAYSISRCSNDYMYRSTRYELNSSMPKCQEIEQRIRQTRETNMSSMMKYLLGEYGKIEAMEDYRESSCTQE